MPISMAQMRQQRPGVPMAALMAPQPPEQATMPNPTPDWLKPENASVFDPWYVRAARTVGGWIGADDPNSQVLAMAAPVEVPGGRVAAPIRAYHGSPHDFEKFSLEKIGTGEGAQAYGHGLYFAENPQVAEDYRRSLAAPTAEAPAFRLKGEPVAHGTDRWRIAQLLDTPKQGESVADMVTRRVKELDDQASFAARAYGEDAATMYRLQAKELQSIDPKDLTFHRPGKMYEVNIHADPEHFLDWDAPLNAQSPQVQEKIKQAWPLADAMDWQTPDFYKAAPYAQRSQELREAGIPGIKYYDQGSRLIAGVNKLGDQWFVKGSMTPYPTEAAARQALEASGQGTRNYVVFDEKLIDIVKKYGVAGALTAGLINEAQARQLRAQGHQ